MVFILLVLREQTIAYLSLLLLGVGVGVTGWFPTAIGLYVTTVVMSIGFHYYETIQSSLTLQWIQKRAAPEVLGRLIAVGSVASLAGYALVWVAMDQLGVDYRWVYLLGGAAPAIAAGSPWPGQPLVPRRVAPGRAYRRLNKLRFGSSRAS